MSAAESVIAPRRAVRTYVDSRGREHYADTHRPVDERLGTHVVLWIVEDPEAWAAAIEAEADAEFTRSPHSARVLAESRRNQRYDGAAEVRAVGPGRSWRTHEHSAEAATAHVEGLRRDCPNPGVRYEIAEITGAGACPDCHQPLIQADGEWRHHAGRYPAHCRPQAAGLDVDERRKPGEWEIDIGRGHMVCGYCDQTKTWPEAVLGYAQLTGFHMLGIERATGELVVLAEATTPGGTPTVLAHHCGEIPADLRAKYARPAEGEVA